MSDRDEVRDDPEGGPPAGQDEVARLLRAAGPRREVPQERSRRVREAVEGHWRAALAGRRRVRWLVLGALPVAAAAASALLATTGLWERIRVAVRPAPVATLQRLQGEVLWPGRTIPAAGEALAAGTAVETGDGGRVALRLGNGASVRFDVGSAARLRSGADLLLERGAVYVDTGAGRGEGGGITVVTPLGTVRDVGTQFQVRATGSTVLVSVREGTATLEHLGGSHRAPSGTQIAIDPDGAVSSRPVAPTAPDWDWVQQAAPAFALEGRRLGEYLDWIERETGLRIRYADPSILADAAAVVLHGSVEGLRPDETLHAVLPTCGLRHRTAGGLVIVERAQ